MSILEDANSLVHGDRNDVYGHPLQDFQRIAVLWSGVLNMLVTPEQVGLCMIAVKLARECYGHQRDSLVDIAGYAECLDMIANAKEPPWTPPTTAQDAAAPSLSPEPSESVPAATPSIPAAVRVESEICPRCQRFQHPAPHRCDP